MRSREQLERTPRQWKDHQRAQAERARRELSGLLERARANREPWYVWIELRAAGVHAHDLTDERGRAIACPVGGCDAVRGATTPHVATARSSSKAD